MNSIETRVLGILVVASFPLSLAIGEASNEYILPFQAGTEYAVYQGNEGPYGHTEHVNFAFDFGLDAGTLVTAARAGVVVKSVETFEDDNGTPGEENVIVLRHSDGTFGRYYHLKNMGSVVHLDQRISVGQPIGYSGNTGASAGPHLHFDVTEGCFDWGCQTIEIRFENVCGDQQHGIPRIGDEVSACPVP
jgi:murein DD-endopeptidase MepM/ murein hydrolase activator NlpD